MQKHTDLTTKEQLHLEMVDLLVEKGNQLHSQAIFDSCAWMVSRAVRLMKNVFGMDRKGMQGSHHGQRLSLKRSHQATA